MKKVFIASAIAMAMASGSAAANQQAEVQFLGVVTEVTCDITPSVNGNTSSVVQLGTIQKGQSGQWVDFALKAKDPAAAGCAGLTGANKVATVVFQGPLGDKGLENTSGTATDATVSLKTVNAKDTAEQTINKTTNSINFAAEKILSDGYQFKAQLNSDNVTGTAGTFDSALAYAVVYN
ncbi:fimbrial protein [Escherichia coli]|uniref:fimbrial protein n=1 Tax=Escherichia coli TaxID=562 RepID=UPI0019181154|nr:fimbrial protein [Escherichia coli]CAD6106152.1 putative fimbrial protein FanC [Escherichia coli]CAD6110232.1 putative fimbrial protein FanC [Escherichia coli]CAD6180679.1 putative fimbrial protein FanC [Escherichia coli]